MSTIWVGRGVGEGGGGGGRKGVAVGVDVGRGVFVGSGVFVGGGVGVRVGAGARICSCRVKEMPLTLCVMVRVETSAAALAGMASVAIAFPLKSGYTVKEMVCKPLGRMTGSVS